MQYCTGIPLEILHLCPQVISLPDPQHSQSHRFSEFHVQFTDSPLVYNPSRFDPCLHLSCCVPMPGQAGPWPKSFQDWLGSHHDYSDFNLCIGHRSRSVTQPNNSYSGQMLNVFTYWLFHHQLSHFWRLTSPFSLAECLPYRLLNLFYCIFIEELYIQVSFLFPSMKYKIWFP